MIGRKLHRYYSFRTFIASHKSLPDMLNDSLNEVNSESQEEYTMANVELCKVKKIGMKKYLVVWEVKGYLKEGRIE